MTAKALIKIIPVAILVCATALTAVFYFIKPGTKGRDIVPPTQAAPADVKTPLPAPVEPDAGVLPGGWREDFVYRSAGGLDAIPAGWVIQNKPGTAPAVFSVEKFDGNGDSFLHMEADRASASVVVRLDGVNLKKTPFLRWRWRVTTLPEGADGRDRARDDQAIGIYVGTGSTLSNKSVSYRWDTKTPRGAEGRCAYGLGVIKVKWYTLRNEDDAKESEWIIEERNLAEDFNEAWGFYPDDVYLSVSCNSQYTGSTAAADLDWIGLDERPQNKEMR